MNAWTSPTNPVFGSRAAACTSLTSGLCSSFCIFQLDVCHTGSYQPSLLHSVCVSGRYYADIIVGLLQDVALQAALHPYVVPDASELEVPPPMFGDNLETASKCLRGELLQQKVQESVVSSCTKDVQ